MVVAQVPLAPLAGHQVLLLLLQLALLLVLALALGRLAGRVGLTPVVGELAAGVLLGPSLLGWAAPGLSGWLFPVHAEQRHLLEAIALIAVLLLVGITGVHLDTRTMRRRAAAVVWVSLGSLIVPLGLGIGAGYLVPDSMTTGQVDRTTLAVFLGVALCVSAIPVIARTLIDLNLLHRDIGQLILAAATLGDAVGWFLLSFVSAMAVAGLGSPTVAVAGLLLLGFIAVAFLLGRPAVDLAMRMATRSAEPGMSAATAVLIVLLGAAAGHAVGLEPVFGAFVAGVLIGASRATDPARLAPLRTIVVSVLAPLFLATVGLRVDLTELRDPTVALVGLVILMLATVGKLVGAYLGARLSRLKHWEGIALGAGLNARGVVEIVVASIGLRLGVLTSATYTVIVLIAVATSLMAPPLLRWAVRRVEQTAEERLRQSELRAWSGQDLAHQVSNGRIPT